MSDKNTIQLPIGLPRWLLFWELFNNSKQLGMGLLQTSGHTQMTLGEAVLEYSILSNDGVTDLYLDYHKGRLIKSLIPKYENTIACTDNNPVNFNTWGYDRDNGDGSCSRILKNITDNLLSACWFGMDELLNAKEHLDQVLSDTKAVVSEDKSDVVHLDVNKMLESSPYIIHAVTSLDDLVLQLDGISSGRLSSIYEQEGETYNKKRPTTRDNLSEEAIKEIIDSNPLSITSLKL